MILYKNAKLFKYLLFVPWKADCPKWYAVRKKMFELLILKCRKYRFENNQFSKQSSGKIYLNYFLIPSLVLSTFSVTVL